MNYKVYNFKAMNMPITIQLVRETFPESMDELFIDTIAKLEQYFLDGEAKYSPYKQNSFVSNHKETGEEMAEFMLEKDYQAIFIETMLAKKETNNIFDAYFNGKYNPTGLVKGWLVEKAFFLYLQPLLDNNMLEAAAINAGGDMQVGVKRNSNFRWNVGIENPYKINKLIATYEVSNVAIATSGINKRGNHILTNEKIVNEQVTIVGKYLSIVDVWATVGVACSLEKLKQFIKKERMMGVIVNSQNIIPFEQGEIINVKKS